MPFEEYGQGRCINCGFLGKTGKRTFDGDCVTASRDDRAEGNLYRHWFESGKFTDTVPWCLVNEANLWDEIEQLQGPANPGAITVISKERDCKGWYRWREFSSPKEHLAERNMQQLEFDRRKWEKSLETNRRHFDIFLVGVTILVALAAIFFTVATIPNDSWALCRLGIQECVSTEPVVDREDSPTGVVE